MKLGRFSKLPKRFRTRKVMVVKSQTLWLQSCFIHMFLIWTEVLFMQGVSGLYTSLFLDTNYLKMTLRAQNVSGDFEKRLGTFFTSIFIYRTVSHSCSLSRRFYFYFEKMSMSPLTVLSFDAYLYTEKIITSQILCIQWVLNQEACNICGSVWMRSLDSYTFTRQVIS